MPISHMGHFTAIGMRTPIRSPDALVINTCARNDTAELGDLTHWVWANPTNRAIVHRYHDIEAVSVECLWQGTKILQVPGPGPDPKTLAGDWRRGKGKRPAGAYAGPEAPLIRDQGAARRAIYIPAFRRLIEHWLTQGADALIAQAKKHDGPVYLRDFDTGRGLDRNGPMSHAWVLATWLNAAETSIEALTW
jgi:hypothetical protein